MTVSSMLSKEQALTLHIANLGAARDVAIYGIPGDVTQLRPIRTSETESYRPQMLVPVQDGVLRLSLPERSLVTLTNVLEAPPNRRRTRLDAGGIPSPGCPAGARSCQ